jgi:hypothetical protein
MGNRQLDRSIDAVLHLPSETAELKVVEMQSDLTSSLAFMDRLFDDLCMVTHLPAVVLGRPATQSATCRLMPV